RARAHAQGGDDLEGAIGARGADRHPRGNPRSRLGLRGVPLDAHDRQLHRAVTQALRAQRGSAGAFSYGTRGRLPLHGGPASDGGHGRMSGARDGLLMKAIRREPVPRPPLWIMRQAGRSLPEYREFRERHSFKALAGDSELAAEVTLMPLKRFALDAAIVFADISSPLPAPGSQVDAARGAGTRVRVRAGPRGGEADSRRARARAAPRSRARGDRAGGDRRAEAHARRLARLDRSAR